MLRVGTTSGAYLRHVNRLWITLCYRNSVVQPSRAAGFVIDSTFRERNGTQKRNSSSYYWDTLRLSEKLAALLGIKHSSRQHALKRLWVIIKDRNLQDPSNKKIIECDEDFEKTFKKKRMCSCEIAKHLDKHLY